MNRAKETVVSATVHYFHCTQLFVSKPKHSTDYKHVEPWKQGLQKVLCSNNQQDNESMNLLKMSD